MSDINIGALSEAINDKMDRDAQNVDTTAGADVVVAFQVPTSDNSYTWYRKYKSGWVEQGGTITANSDAAYIQILPVTMANSGYQVQITRNTTQDYTGSALNGRWQEVYNVTTTSFTTWGKYSGYPTIFWEAKGQAA